jgi:SPP1 family predicted phage head-tail adaptor
MIRNAKKFVTSDMRHRIIVDQPVSAPDGRGQWIITWQVWLPSEPASYDEVAGGETLHGKQVEAGITAVFRVNYRPGYTTQHRIRFQGVTYGITRVAPIDGLDRYREIHCKAVK